MSPSIESLPSVRSRTATCDPTLATWKSSARSIRTDHFCATDSVVPSSTSDAVPVRGEYTATWSSAASNTASAPRVRSALVDASNSSSRLGRCRPELTRLLVADHRGAAGEEDLRSAGGQGDGVPDGRVGHVDLRDGALGLVDAVDHRPTLEHREPVRCGLDGGVELQDLRVRPPHGPVLRRRHPDGTVTEVDALRVVAARHDGGTRDQGRDDHGRTDRHRSGPVPREQPPDHDPLPMVAQRCALAAPVLPSRFTATAMHSSSPADPDTTNEVPDCWLDAPLDEIT